MEKALDVKAAADILNISQKFLYRLAAQKLVPCFRIGSAVRFLPSQLEAYMHGQWQPATPKARRGRKKKDYGQLTLAQLTGQAPHSTVQ